MTQISEVPNAVFMVEICIQFAIFSCSMLLRAAYVFNNAQVVDETLELKFGQTILNLSTRWATYFSRIQVWPVCKQLPKVWRFYPYILRISIVVKLKCSLENKNPVGRCGLLYVFWRVLPRQLGERMNV